MSEMTRAKGKAQEVTMVLPGGERVGLGLYVTPDDMTINVFCKKYLRDEADRLLANGTFEAQIREHIKTHGESPSGAYNVRFHGAGTTITVWSAQ
jgi:hypothetical protein